MPKLTKVEWFKEPGGLNEIYQQTGMLFSFASSTPPQKELKQCHEWVKCRDFLPDAVRSQITKKKCGIYGFSFDTEKNPSINLNKMRMLVTETNEKGDTPAKFKKKIVSSLKLLNHFEKMANVVKTRVTQVNTADQSKYKTIFLFVGPSMWLKSPFLVSMFSFLIRLGDKEIKFENHSELEKKLKHIADDHSAGKIMDNDASYLKNSWNKLELVIKNRSKIFHTKNRVHDVYLRDYSISEFHNQSGLNSLVKCKTMDTELNTNMQKLIEKNIQQ